MKTSFLFVTCCLEPSRAAILQHVIDNLLEQVDASRELTVFDNGSTQPGVVDQLVNNFRNVYRTERNVGYWSAIDWWLETQRGTDVSYSYIIESDMMHYAFNRIDECIAYLDKHSDVGSVRLHEYSINERHLYDKDNPRPDSKRSIWQSHTNRVTNKPVKIDHSEGDIYSTTFLTQLPALNRMSTMFDVFEQLRKMGNFTERDFQRLYWEHHQRTAILDGGIFNCDMGSYGAKTVTGSWTSDDELSKIGYQATRKARLVPFEQYRVDRLV